MKDKVIYETYEGGIIDTFQNIDNKLLIMVLQTPINKDQ